MGLRRPQVLLLPVLPLSAAVGRPRGWPSLGAVGLGAPGRILAPQVEITSIPSNNECAPCIDLGTYKI